MMSYDYPHPVSRTYQYKKITKPLLERKRRARINRCLDELKDLMVDALETEGENISKLEKADILELTVRHLQRLHASRPSGLSPSASPNEDATSSENRWQSGFGHCAAEACRYLAALPGESGERLARHLASGLQTTRRSPINSALSKTLVAPSPIVVADGTTNFSQPISSDSPMELSVMMDSRDTDSPFDSSRYSVVSEISDNQDINDVNQASISIRVFDSVDREIPIKSKTNPAVLRNDNENSSTKLRLSENKFTKIDGRSVGADDDEEIDVEGVDESDPMWRPW